MPVRVPSKKVRDGMIRPPCNLCGGWDDGIEHVAGPCTVAIRARELFTMRVGVDVTPATLGAASVIDAAQRGVRV